MLEKFGRTLTRLFLRFMPDAFVFAILLTLLCAAGALICMGSTPLEVITSWYNGFFNLLAFAMQIALIIVTGFSIALSPQVGRLIDAIARRISTPSQVYFLVVAIGMFLSMVSFGWIVITAVFARELAERVKGVHYGFLIACVYFSMNSWVLGLSSTIPLLLNTENNYLIQAGTLDAVIPTSVTLGAGLNIAMMVLMIVAAPVLFFLLRPKQANGMELSDLQTGSSVAREETIEEEARQMRLPYRALSDLLNNSRLLTMIMVGMGVAYIIHHLLTRGVDLDLNIMIFLFLVVGMTLHKTPMQYVISMKRSSRNIADVLYQYPFYAGIMGIMLGTGLGSAIGSWMASLSTADTYPVFAYITGAVVNFAIPSAGGEFAVVGPSVIQAVQEVSAGMPAETVTAMIARASLSVAYGESLSNMLQPFFLLMVLPVMGAGTRIQARDVMGFLVIPTLLFIAVQLLMVVYWPI